MCWLLRHWKPVAAVFAALAAFLVGGRRKDVGGQSAAEDELFRLAVARESKRRARAARLERDESKSAMVDTSDADLDTDVLRRHRERGGE